MSADLYIEQYRDYFRLSGLYYDLLEVLAVLDDFWCLIV
jgi:hypothetical protein